MLTPTSPSMGMEPAKSHSSSYPGVSLGRVPEHKLLPAGENSKIPKLSIQLPTSSVLANSKSMLKKVDLRHPASKNWLIHLHYVRREFNTCKSIIHEELQRLNGNSEYANYILALIYRSEGKVQESLDRLQVCHQLEPTNADTVRQIARSLFLLGRHKLAIDAYQKSQILNDDSDWETHYNMGLCYLYMKDLEKAKEHMNLSLQARVSQEAFQVLGQIALARHSVQEAISVYEKAVRIFPENPDLLSNLGVLYMKSGKDTTSFLKLSSALSFDPCHPKAIVATASMMQTHEDFDFALSKYKVAMCSIPDSSSLWNNIGMCYFGKKKYVAAISCLKRAYYLTPFDWKILHNLGLVHLHMQQYASAFHFLTAAINLKPDQSHNFMLLAVAISHLDDMEHARQAYEQALKLNKLNPRTDSLKLLLNYSISLFNHKDFDESFRKVLEANQNYEKDPLKYDDETRDLLIRMKTSLQLMDYKLPEPQTMTAPSAKAKEKPSSSATSAVVNKPDPEPSDAQGNVPAEKPHEPEPQPKKSAKSRSKKPENLERDLV